MVITPDTPLLKKAAG